MVLAAERRKARPFLGSSIKNGFIRYSSVSQITLFDPHEEGGCPRKWAFAYVFGKKLARVEAQQEGELAGEKLEWWLRTGEDLLPPLLQPAKKFYPSPGPDLECEEFFGDIPSALRLRDQQLAYGERTLTAEIERLAGLSACGIPLDGAADVRHYRGVYADEEGNLREEAPGQVVAEVLDQKTTKRIDGRWTRGRAHYLQGYAKTHAQVTNAAQMIGYGVQVANKHSRLTHVRLSHVYAQKDPQGFAAKRGGLVSVDELRERWRRGPEAAMAQMIEFAQASRIEDVPANPTACSAYNHIGPDGKSRPGCGHVYYCPLQSEQVSMGIFNSGIRDKEPGMSLFDRVNNERGQVNGVTHPTPPSPPPPASTQSEADFQAEVTRQREKLLQEDAMVAAKSKIMAGTLRLDPSGQVFDREGAEAGGWIQRWPTEIEKAAFVTIQPPPPNPVRPPDAPEISTLAGARPVSDAQLAEVTDPELRAKIVAHREIHAERDAATVAAEAEEQQASEQSGGIWCPGGSKRITITTEMALQRKMTCQCGKKIALKPVKEGEAYVSSIPRHKLPKAEEAGREPPQAVQPPQVAPAPPPAAVAPTPLAPAPPAPPPPAPSMQTSFPTVAVSPPAPPAASMQEVEMFARAAGVSDVVVVKEQGLYAHGVCVLFDVLVEKGQALMTLESYYRDILRGLEKKFGVIDIRVEPNKSSLIAYGAWKGVLQHECRQKPPAPGVYVARSSNEFDRAVVEGLAEHCAFVGYGAAR